MTQSNTQALIKAAMEAQGALAAADAMLPYGGQLLSMAHAAIDKARPMLDEALAAIEQQPTNKQNALDCEVNKVQPTATCPVCGKNMILVQCAGERLACEDIQCDNNLGAVQPTGGGEDENMGEPRGVTRCSVGIDDTDAHKALRNIGQSKAGVNPASPTQPPAPVVEAELLERIGRSLAQYDEARNSYRESNLEYKLGTDLRQLLDALVLGAALQSPARVEGWRPIESAPRDVPIQIGHKGFGWVGTGVVHDYEDADGHVQTSTTVQHYNGNILVSSFYATHWQPLPTPPKPVGEV